MDANIYKSNSNKDKENKVEEPEVKTKQLVQGVVKEEKKKGFFSKFFSDGLGSIGTYLWNDILVPAFKKTLNDMISDGTSMILFGTPKNKQQPTNYNRISYNSYSNVTSYNRPRPTTTYAQTDVTVDTKNDADTVLNTLYDLLQQYGVVRVADFYDIVGLPSSFTDNKFGWMDISTADIIRTTEGRYWIKMPKAMPID